MWLKLIIVGKWYLNKSLKDYQYLNNRGKKEKINNQVNIKSSCRVKQKKLIKKRNKRRIKKQTNK
jgi:hypothetical protein